MDKLTHLLSLCYATVYLHVNEHKNSYMSLSEWIKEHRDEWSEEDVTEDIIQKMIEADTLIDLHVYPDTPVGSYKIVHYDLETALDRMIAAIERDRATAPQP